MKRSMTRREFVRGMTAAGLATIAGGAPRSLRATEPVEHPRATADTCILLWMAGGMAAPETFEGAAGRITESGEGYHWNEDIWC